MRGSVKTAQFCALGFLFLIALCSSLFVVHRLHTSHARAAAQIWNGVKTRQNHRQRRSQVKASVSPEHLIWPSSTVSVVDTAFCRGDSLCEKNVLQNPVIKYVRFHRHNLILHGINKSEPLLQKLPLKSYFGEDEFKLVVLGQTELNTRLECDAVLADGPVIVDYPYHCRNAFHVHNDNIFKHLISADMVGMVDKLEQFTLLRRRARCRPMELLKRWYQLFRKEMPLAKQLRHNKTLCIGQVQFSQAAFEIFNRRDMRGYKRVPPSKISHRLVDIFREIFSTRIGKLPIHGIVDRSSAEGKLVVLLGRNGTRPFREVRPVDKLRMKEAFLTRGLRFKIFQNRDDYYNLEKLWAALAEASIVIGPHGAGLMNALYVRTNAVVFELRTRYSRQHRYFEAMSSFLGLQHVHVDLREYSDGHANATANDIRAFADLVIDVFERRVHTHNNSVVNTVPLVNASLMSVSNRS